jgi:hypothetical protein
MTEELARDNRERYVLVIHGAFYLLRDKAESVDARQLLNLT